MVSTSGPCSFTATPAGSMSKHRLNLSFASYGQAIALASTQNFLLDAWMMTYDDCTTTNGSPRLRHVQMIGGPSKLNKDSLKLSETSAQILKDRIFQKMPLHKSTNMCLTRFDIVWSSEQFSLRISCQRFAKWQDLLYGLGSSKRGSLFVFDPGRSATMKNRIAKWAGIGDSRDCQIDILR